PCSAGQQRSTNDQSGKFEKASHWSVGIDGIDRTPDEPRHQDAESIGNDDQPEAGSDAEPAGAYIGEDTTKFRHDRKRGHREIARQPLKVVEAASFRGNADAAQDGTHVAPAALRNVGAPVKVGRASAAIKQRRGEIAWRGL